MNWKAISAIAAFITAGVGLVVNWDTLIKKLGLEAEYDVSGEWMIRLQIDESTYKPYVGSSATYKVHLTQKDRDVIGTGEMWQVRDKDIPYSQHIKIDFEGKVESDSLFMTFHQYGAKRTSSGSFQAELFENGKKLRGRYSSNGANWRGPLTAYWVKR